MSGKTLGTEKISPEFEDDDNSKDLLTIILTFYGKAYFWAGFHPGVLFESLFPWHRRNLNRHQPVERKPGSKTGTIDMNVSGNIVKESSFFPQK